MEHDLDLAMFLWNPGVLGESLADEKCGDLVESIYPAIYRAREPIGAVRASCCLVSGRHVLVTEIGPSPLVQLGNCASLPIMGDVLAWALDSGGGLS